MTTSTTVASPSDLSDLCIDLSLEWEVEYWTRKLGVSPQDLARAVQATGCRLAMVVALLLVEKPRRRQSSDF